MADLLPMEVLVECLTDESGSDYCVSIAMDRAKVRSKWMRSEHQAEKLAATIRDAFGLAAGVRADAPTDADMSKLAGKIASTAKVIQKVRGCSEREAVQRAIEALEPYEPLPDGVPVVVAVNPSLDQGRGEALAASPSSASASPATQPLAKHQPCGCVICTCEDEDQCHGCGARHCGTHALGQFPAVVQASEPAQPDGYYEPMFNAAVASLAEISKALGIPDDEAACANGNELILEAIVELPTQPVGEVIGEGMRYEAFTVPEVRWSVPSLPVGTKLYAAFLPDGEPPKGGA